MCIFHSIFALYPNARFLSQNPYIHRIKNFSRTIHLCTPRSIFEHNQTHIICPSSERARARCTKPIIYHSNTQLIYICYKRCDGPETNTNIYNTRIYLYRMWVRYRAVCRPHLIRDIIIEFLSGANVFFFNWAILRVCGYNLCQVHHCAPHEPWAASVWRMGWGCDSTNSSIVNKAYKSGTANSNGMKYKIDIEMIHLYQTF